VAQVLANIKNIFRGESRGAETVTERMWVGANTRIKAAKTRETCLFRLGLVLAEEAAADSIRRKFFLENFFQ